MAKKKKAARKKAAATADNSRCGGCPPGFTCRRKLVDGTYKWKCVRDDPPPNPSNA
jgi:hypothetical protein